MGAALVCAEREGPHLAIVGIAYVMDRQVDLDTEGNEGVDHVSRRPPDTPGHRATIAPRSLKHYNN